MTEPQVPTDWNPATYAVDEYDKVVWKQSNHAVAMGLRTKRETLIPGYKIYLCTSEELPAIRNRIKVQQEERLKRNLEEFTEEEWKQFSAEEKERSIAKRERERQELLQRRTKLATEAGRPPEAGIVTEDEWNRVWRKRAIEISFQKGKAAVDARKEKEEKDKEGISADGWTRRKSAKKQAKENIFVKRWKDSLENPYIFLITWVPQVAVGGALAWVIGSSLYSPPPEITADSRELATQSCFAGLNSGLADIKANSVMNIFKSSEYEVVTILRTYCKPSKLKWDGYWSINGWVEYLKQPAEKSFSQDSDVKQVVIEGV